MSRYATQSLSVQTNQTVASYFCECDGCGEVVTMSRFDYREGFNPSGWASKRVEVTPGEYAERCYCPDCKQYQY